MSSDIFEKGWLKEGDNIEVHVIHNRIGGKYIGVIQEISENNKDILINAPHRHIATIMINAERGPVLYQLTVPEFCNDILSNGLQRVLKRLTPDCPILRLTIYPKGENGEAGTSWRWEIV